MPPEQTKTASDGAEPVSEQHRGDAAHRDTSAVTLAGFARSDVTRVIAEEALIAAEASAKFLPPIEVPTEATDSTVTAQAFDGRRAVVNETRLSDGTMQVSSVQLSDGSEITRSSDGKTLTFIDNLGRKASWRGNIKVAVESDGTSPRLEFSYQYPKTPHQANAMVVLDDGTEVAIKDRVANKLPGQLVSVIDSPEEAALSSVSGLGLNLTPDRLKLESHTRQDGVISTTYEVHLNKEESDVVRNTIATSTDAEFTLAPSGEKLEPAKPETVTLGSKPNTYDRPLADHTATLAPMWQDNGRWMVMTGIRANEPFKGAPCLPGGFLEADEQPNAAMVREFAEEMNLELTPDAVTLAHVMRQDKDTRSVIDDADYVARLTPQQAEKLTAGDDLKGQSELQPRSLDELLSIPDGWPGGLAFSHRVSLEYSLRVLDPTHADSIIASGLKERAGKMFEKLPEGTKLSDQDREHWQAIIDDANRSLQHSNWLSAAEKALIQNIQQSARDMISEDPNVQEQGRVHMRQSLEAFNESDIKPSAMPADPAQRGTVQAETARLAEKALVRALLTFDPATGAWTDSSPSTPLPVQKGESYDAVVQRAMQEAQRTGGRVNFRFNGADVTVAPDSKAEDVREAYTRGFEHVQRQQELDRLVAELPRELELRDVHAQVSGLPESGVIRLLGKIAQATKEDPELKLDAKKIVAQLGAAGYRELDTSSAVTALAEPTDADRAYAQVRSALTQMAREGEITYLTDVTSGEYATAYIGAAMTQLETRGAMEPGMAEALNGYYRRTSAEFRREQVQEEKLGYSLHQQKDGSGSVSFRDRDMKPEEQVAKAIEIAKERGTDIIIPGWSNKIRINKDSTVEGVLKARQEQLRQAEEENKPYQGERDSWQQEWDQRRAQAPEIVNALVADLPNVLDKPAAERDAAVVKWFHDFAGANEDAHMTQAQKKEVIDRLTAAGYTIPDGLTDEQSAEFVKTSHGFARWWVGQGLQLLEKRGTVPDKLQILTGQYLEKFVASGDTAGGFDPPPAKAQLGQRQSATEKPGSEGGTEQRDDLRLSEEPLADGVPSADPINARLGAPKNSVVKVPSELLLMHAKALIHEALDLDPYANSSRLGLLRARFEKWLGRYEPSPEALRLAGEKLAAAQTLRMQVGLRTDTYSLPADGIYHVRRLTAVAERIRLSVLATEAARAMGQDIKLEIKGPPGSEPGIITVSPIAFDATAERRSAILGRLSASIESFARHGVTARDSVPPVKGRDRAGENIDENLRLSDAAETPRPSAIKPDPSAVLGNLMSSINNLGSDEMAALIKPGEPGKLGLAEVISKGPGEIQTYLNAHGDVPPGVRSFLEHIVQQQRLQVKTPEGRTGYESIGNQLLKERDNAKAGLGGATGGAFLGSLVLRLLMTAERSEAVYRVPVAISVTGN